jgi:N-methylhydantoinase B
MRKRELIQDSGGAGKFRGGLGQEMILQVRTRKPAVHSPMYDRLKFPAKGYAGGKDGRCGDFLLADGRHPHPKTKYVLQPEQEAILRLPGGGGFYAAFERDPELVRQDVINGYVSVHSARSEYGVWIEEGGYTIDWAKTAELRK